MVQDYSSIIGIVGVVVGALLTFILNSINDWKNNNNKTKSIKLLIFYEMSRNDDLIRDFAKEINENSKKTKKEKQYILENIPLPPLNNGMYTKFALFLPNSLYEFENIYEFYRELDDLKFKYDKMILILTKDHTMTYHWNSTNMPDEVIPMKMPEYDEILLNKLWKEFEATIDNLLNTVIEV